MNHAIILAGGISERIAEINMPKQFAMVADTPIIVYSLSAFQRCDEIDKISIVASDAWIPQLTEWLQHYKIDKFENFVQPGATRQSSIYNGLCALKNIAAEDDIIVVHDAARPCVSVDDIKNCVSSAANYDGATPIIDVCDTIYQSKDGTLISTLLNRDELYAGQTPESYRFGQYLAAHIKFKEHDKFRGSSEIAFRSGMNVRLYKGNPANFKISHLSDLEFFEFSVKKRIRKGAS